MKGLTPAELMLVNTFQVNEKLAFHQKTRRALVLLAKQGIAAILDAGKIHLPSDSEAKAYAEYCKDLLRRRREASATKERKLR
jgi:hypothetical protein